MTMFKLFLKFKKIYKFSFMATLLKITAGELVDTLSTRYHNFKVVGRTVLDKSCLVKNQKCA